MPERSSCIPSTRAEALWWILPVPFLILPNRESFRFLSTAGLTGVPAAILPFYELNKIIADNQVELPVKRHRD